jgi:hypothetical protein
VLIQADSSEEKTALSGPVQNRVQTGIQKEANSVDKGV